MKNLDNNRLFIFDLDGVIFDSKRNMQLAWGETSKKFNLNIPFQLYFRKIGMPFLKILESLSVQASEKIFQCFKKKSLKEIQVIKPYKNVIKILEYLKCFFEYFQKYKLYFFLSLQKTYNNLFFCTTFNFIDSTFFFYFHTIYFF